ncbi:RNA phosphate cyclase [Escherichia coli]|uniref:RNA phosphate cyclase n=1 Tax=Escherichia coli TaxID=562 RepID=A0A2X3K389_ECOLX|nr:RNA phosphate cyclase [Escherichia coli]
MRPLVAKVAIRVTLAESSRKLPRHVAWGEVAKANQAAPRFGVKTHAVASECGVALHFIIKVRFNIFLALA